MKKTITGYITCAQYGQRDAKEISFSVYRPNPEYSPHTVVVREHSFEVDIADDFDVRPGLLSNLEEQKRQVRAEFAKKVKEIDDRIQQLLALENTVEA